MSREYQVCTRCVMDTTDPEIEFDDNGYCNHCRDYYENVDSIVFRGEDGESKLQSLISEIKEYGKKKKYDCILGLSGGVDSSFLAHELVKRGLRPLTVHVDCGWNSEQAVKNIENIVKKLDLDLITHVVNWPEMKDLQVAFLKSGVANQDTPQDHAIFALLYNYANKNGIKYVVSGHNYETESILPGAWGYTAMDLIQLKDIHKKFGRIKLKTFPLLGMMKYRLLYLKHKGMKVVSPLNLLEYNKGHAMDLLKKELNWEYYGGKHYESKFTKFFQAYYLPKRFNFDKRKAHLSSLIVSGQLTREAAVNELKQELYPKDECERDISYVCKKLGFSTAVLDSIMKSPLKRFCDYKSLGGYASELKHKYPRLFKVYKKVFK